MSSITWQTFRDTDFSGFEDTAELWVRYIRDSAEIEEALFSDIEVLSSDDSGDFDGLTADATRAHIRRVSDVFVQDLTDYAERIKQLLYVAGEDFEAKRGDLVDLLAEAGTQLVPTGGIGEERFEISASSPSDFHDTGGTTAAERQEERLRQVERAEAFTEEFRALMAEVRQIDDDLASELRKLDDAAPDLPPTIGTADYSEKTAEYLQELHQDFLDKIESGEATPEEVNKWWNSLSEGDRELFVHELPELVGPVDGIPADDRDTANRNLLDQEIDSFSPTLDEDIAALEAQLEEMRANGEQYAPTGNLGVPYETSEYRELREQLEALEAQRDDYNALLDLQNAITDAAPTGQEHYLLGFDTEDDGGAIVAIGNPDTADNTGIFVPGTFSTIDNFAGEDGALERATAMASDAQRYGIPGEETAMIAWLDYDAPQSASPTEAFGEDAWDWSKLAPEAGFGGAAEDGAQTLNHFIDGLDASHQGKPSNTTIAGHSYGGLLVGETAQDPDTGADQVILVAAPGADVDHASELAVGQENVWATMAEGDAITFPAGESVIHGHDPTNGTFGGNVFSSDASGSSGGDIHGGYWDEDNVARKNMARIITGQTSLVEPVEG